MTSSPLTVTVSHDGQICVIAATGDLDLTSAARFTRYTSRALDEEPERLVFDLAGLTFLDCAGARALGAAAQAAPVGCPVIIRSVSSIAARMVELLGLDLERQAELTAPAPHPEADRDPQPAPDLASAHVRAVNPNRARLIRAAQELAVTEEQVAATFARLATQHPAQAGQLTALSQSARAYATRTRQWAHSHQAPASTMPAPQPSGPGPAS